MSKRVSRIVLVTFLMGTLVSINHPTAMVMFQFIFYIKKVPFALFTDYSRSPLYNRKRPLDYLIGKCRTTVSKQITILNLCYLTYKVSSESLGDVL